MWLITGGLSLATLAVVTETGGLAASVTESAGHIWAELAGRCGPSLVLLEHSPRSRGLIPAIFNDKHGFSERPVNGHTSPPTRAHLIFLFAI